MRIKRQNREKWFRLPLETAKREVTKREAEINYKLSMGWNPFENELETGSELSSNLKTDIELFLNSRALYSKSTVHSYTYFFRRLQKYFGDYTQTESIGRKDYEKYLTGAITNPVSRSTYSGMIRTFTRFLASKGRKVEEFKFKAEKRVAGHIKYFTEAELEAVCAVIHEVVIERNGYLFAPPEVHVLIWKLAFYLGFRRSGVYSIKKVDVLEGYIRVMEKGNKIRMVPVIDKAEAVVSALMQYPGEYLVPTRNSVDNWKNLRLCIKKALPAHRQKLNFHSLRHGCATYWLDRGLAITDISELLGHADLETTLIYAKVRPVMLAERMKKLV
jgi:integrase